MAKCEPKRVLIIGGGASGTLLASELLRRIKSPLALDIAEPRLNLGQGVAYATRDKRHLLNVVASKMSAKHEEPEHFALWGKFKPEEFAPRVLYGRYLEDVLQESLLCAGNLVNFRHLNNSVQDFTVNDSNVTVVFESHQIETYDFVVLAVGHSSIQIPQALRNIPDSPSIVLDVWEERNHGLNQIVLSVGTGLTFIDQALTVLNDSKDTTVIGVSRSGNLPREHEAIRAASIDPPLDAIDSPEALMKHMLAAGDRWRETQDGLRSITQEIWERFSKEEKLDWMEKYSREWNRHRFRMSPENYRQIKQYESQGRLRLIATELESLQDFNESFIVSLKNGEIFKVDQILNCCGNALESDQSLIEALLDKNCLQRGPLGMGLSFNLQSFCLRKPDGSPHANIFAIGPILVGELFEPVGVPEIRTQAVRLATKLLDLI